MGNRLDSLNALEEASAEEVARQAITVLQDDEAPKVRMMCALAWVHKRRTDPKLTFDAYLKTARFRDALDYLLGSDDEADDDTDSEDGDADPFPGGPGTGGAEAAPAGPADAEGAVLSGDGPAAG